VSPAYYVLRANGLQTPQGLLRVQLCPDVASAAVAKWNGTSWQPVDFTHEICPQVIAENVGDQYFVVGQSRPAAVTVTGPASARYLETTTFTATVTAADGTADTPTGTVTFTDGSEDLGTAGVNAGVATLPVTLEHVGTRTITATFNGTSAWGTGVGAANVDVLRADTRVVVGPLMPGSSQRVTINGAVFANAPSTGVPDGSVEVLVDGNVVRTASLGSLANFEVTVLMGAGQHNVVVRYGATTNFNGSETPALAVPVAKVPATFTSVAFPSSSVYSAPLSFEANVVSLAEAATPLTGTVTLMHEATALGSATIDALGHVSIPLSQLEAGPYELVAVYSGDADHAVTTLPLSTAVAPATTTVAGTFAPVAPVFGEPIVFMATLTVTPATAGFADGAVSLVVDGQERGEVAAIGNEATFPAFGLGAGHHTAQLQFAGSRNYAPSDSAPIEFDVNRADSSTVATVTPNQVPFGDPVTVNATVDGGTGTVEIREGTTTLGAATLSATAQASFTTSSLSVGPHDLTAHYLGDSNLNPSASAPASVIITQRQIGATLDVGAPTVFGQPITMTVTFLNVPAAAPQPAGLITFVDGTTPIAGCESVPASTPQCVTAALSIGAHTIAITYSGDANYSAASAGASHVVTRGQSATAIDAAPGPFAFGSSVQLLAFVNPAPPSTGTPLGTVRFVVGSTPIVGCESVALTGSGRATCAWPAVAVGSYQFRALYSGDGNFDASASGAITRSVVAAPTTTTVTSSPNPSTERDRITFVASVSMNPPGAVMFQDGGLPIKKCEAVALTAGAATCDAFLTVPGPHAITASYLGSTNHAPSAGTTTHIVIGPASASTSTVTASPLVVAVGGTTTITVVLRDAFGTPVPFATVRLTTDAKRVRITPNSASTDASGAATFTATSPIAGDVVFTATENKDHVTVTQTATVNFTR
jgi:large repetitive protein